MRLPRGCIVLTRQLIHGEVGLDLMLVNHPGCQRLLRHLTIINLLLHCPLCQEPIDVHWLCLPETEHPEDALDIVGGIPGGVEDDDTVGGHQVDPQPSSLGGDEEEPHPMAGRPVEELAPDLSRVGGGRPVHPVIVLSRDPGVQVAGQR